jgi:hypothetical protein
VKWCSALYERKKPIDFVQIIGLVYVRYFAHGSQDSEISCTRPKSVQQ